MTIQISSIQSASALSAAGYSNYSIPGSAQASEDMLITAQPLVSAASMETLLQVFTTNEPGVLVIIKSRASIDAKGYYNYIPTVSSPIDALITASELYSLAAIPGSSIDIGTIRNTRPFITTPVLPVDVFLGYGIVLSSEAVVSQTQLPFIVLDVRQNFILTPVEEIEVSQLDRPETIVDQKIRKGLESAPAQVVNNNLAAYQTANGSLDELTVEQKKNFAAQILSNSRPKDRRNTLGHFVNRYSSNTRRI
jgi:hypothetical protein